MVGNAPVGFLSDAHGNAGALRAGLALLKGEGAQEIFFLGDAIGYIPSVETIEILVEQSIPCLAGNHEVAVLDRNYASSRDEVYQLRKIADQILSRWQTVMERWPHERLIESGRSSLHLVHGSPRDPVDEYLHPDTPLDDLVGFAKAPFVVMGHSHRPFVRSAGGTTFVNVGSCGLPRDDARWGAVALFYPADARWRILRFDISEHSETALARYSVHQSVKDLFAKRRSEEIFGEITC